MEPGSQLVIKLKLEQHYKLDNIFKTFIRRYDGHKFEKLMKRGAVHAFFDSKTKEEFKRELAESTIGTYLYLKDNIDTTDIDPNEMSSTIDYIISVYGSLMDFYYRDLKKNYPMH